MPGVIAPSPLRARPRGLTLLLAATLLIPNPAGAQSAGAVALPPDSAHWVFEGRAEVTEYLGRRCIMLDGGAATVKDLDLRDGVIDMDVATPAARGFFGIQFRADSVNAEFVYLRQHKSGLPDAMQYTPVLNTGLNWQLYSGPGFTGAVDIPRETWFHLRLAIAGAQARLYVQDTTKPALDMPDLKSGRERGQVALADLIGATCFSNVEIHPTPDAPWQRQLAADAPRHAGALEPLAGVRRARARSRAPALLGGPEGDAWHDGGGGAAGDRGDLPLSRGAAPAGHASRATGPPGSSRSRGRS